MIMSFGSKLIYSISRAKFINWFILFVRTSWVVCSCCSTSSVVFVVTRGPESTTTSPSSRTTCRFTLVSICRVVVISFFLRVSHSSERRKRVFFQPYSQHRHCFAKLISRSRTNGHKTRVMSRRWQRERCLLCLCRHRCQLSRLRRHPNKRKNSYILGVNSYFCARDVRQIEPTESNVKIF